MDHAVLMDRGMFYIAEVRKMLGHLPLHRGMANAFLNGDHSFQEKMDDMQKTIAGDMAAVDECMSRHAMPATLISRWQRIKDNWHNLRTNLGSISPNESFEKHSVIIADILSLISDSADDMRINSHPDNDLQKISRTVFNQLPATIEIIGQARGIGAGAAAKGNVVTDVRIKLQFLHGRLTRTLATTRQTIEACLQHSRSQFNIKQQAISDSFSDTQLFLSTLSENMLANGNLHISAEEYFSIGSKAFDSNIQMFDEISAALKEDLQHRIPRLRKNLKLSIAGSIVLLVSLAAIWQQYIFA